jgi:hypothetical protein
MSIKNMTLKKPLGITPGKWKVVDTGIGPAVAAGPGESELHLVVAANGFGAHTAARRRNDANLVAAAPQLLDLVKRVFSAASTGTSAEEIVERFGGECKAAIDKAHGRTP